MNKNLSYFGMVVSIPEDVRKGIIKRLVLKAISFILLEALTITTAYFFSQGSGVLATQMTYLVAAFIPVLLTKVPFCFFDKTYIGKIEKVNVETVSQTETAMKLFNKNIVTLYICLESGNVLVKKANEGRLKNASVVNEYKENDIVIHLYGTDYIVPLPDNKAFALNKKCFLCGQTSSNEADKCYHCGHSLLDNSDL